MVRGIECISLRARCMIYRHRFSDSHASRSKHRKDDARCSPAFVDNADRTRSLGYANTNLSGRHFNDETMAYGQREWSEWSRRSRMREDTRSDSLKVGSQSVSQIGGQRGQPGPGRRGGKEREQGRTKCWGKEREPRVSEGRTLGRHPRAVYHVARISFWSGLAIQGWLPAGWPHHATLWGSL